MALNNTVADMVLTGAWADAYAATGITVGTAVTINNKSSSDIFVWLGTSAPSNPSGGYQVASKGYLSIGSGATGLWINGTGNILVQD